MSHLPMGFEPASAAAPPPLAYQISFDAQSRDEGHLTALSICHYVFAGLTILFSCLFIIYIIVGLAILAGRLNFPTPAPPPGIPAGNVIPEPHWFGWALVGMGSVPLVLGWTMGILAVCSGICMGRRRRRTFSTVVAGICCLAVPLGTILGIFTIIVLQRESVRAMYAKRELDAGRSA